MGVASALRACPFNASLAHHPCVSLPLRRTFVQEMEAEVASLHSDVVERFGGPQARRVLGLRLR